jgi:hypothetical protein
MAEQNENGDRDPNFPARAFLLSGRKLKRRRSGNQFWGMADHSSQIGALHSVLALCGLNYKGAGGALRSKEPGFCQ